MNELDPRDHQSGIIDWFVKNPVAANLIMVFLLMGGVLATIHIDKATFPPIRMNHILVEVPVPGATPGEIEQGVTAKIEDAIGEIQGVGEIFSKATDNVGMVRLEVVHGFSVSEVLDEASVRVNAISGFPQRAGTPMVRKVAAKGDEVIAVQIHGSVEERALLRILKGVREEILQLPGVSQARIDDEKAYEISVEVSNETMRRHGLSIPEVVQAIRSHSLDLASGTIESSHGGIRLRTRGQAETIEDFRSIPVRESPDGARITVGDLADVVERAAGEGFTLFDGEPSFSLQVRSAPGEDILRVAREVRDFVARKNGELPGTVRLTCWADASTYLQGRINLMLHNLGAGALLVFVVLLLFLQFRLAFWVIAGIPVAFCGALFLMPFFDVSINMISVFGFILVLGIVVDDAIVVAENVHSTVEREGEGMQSVISGAREVAMPVTFGVITTMVAFVPMTQVTGSFGPVWMSIGVVVILALFFSLVESKLLLPAHLRHIRRDNPHIRPAFYDVPRLTVDRLLKAFITRVYRPLLNFAIDFRYATLALFLSILAVAGALIFSGVIRFVFFPDLPSDFLLARVELPPWTAKTTAREEFRLIEEALRDADQRKGGRISNLRHVRMRTLDTKTAEFFIELTPSETRSVRAQELAVWWSEAVGDLDSGGSFSVSASVLEGEGSAIDFELTGRDSRDLRAAGDRLKDLLQSNQGVYNVKNSLGQDRTEIRLRLKPEGRASGLTDSAVAGQVRQAFYGEEAQRLQRGNDEIKIMVRYPPSERDSLFHLENSWLRNATGDEIPFRNAVALDFEKGPSTLERVNRLRVTRVTAFVDKRFAEPGKIAADLIKSFPADVLDKDFPGITMRLAGQSAEEIKSLQELLYGFILALVGIYAGMAIPLRSYSQPLLIMTAIPFGFVGSVAGHYLMGIPISVLSLCGIIALAGVVVNDSLVFVDFVNRGRLRGMKASEAAREAGAARFRAIFLTSLTTFVGLIPIMLEKSMQAVPVIPMAVTLAFGILFATVVTLFLLPVLFLVAEDVKSRLYHRRESE